eukprot:TRINITY_DN21746_c0_g1_i1.p1 TRINITY_DN21746_c0_g1~~TRINITY_DN21746_c0_g1_i1.p1  ORF type:complete len:315 (-),score=30.35 TRINITY_DN21746_c0_g1_i1:1-945(-)
MNGVRRWLARKQSMELKRDRCYLLGLSEEILLMVLLQLKEVKDKFRVGLVCAYLRRVSQDSSLWKTCGGFKTRQATCDHLRCKWEKVEILQLMMKKERQQMEQIPFSIQPFSAIQPQGSTGLGRTCSIILFGKEKGGRTSLWTRIKNGDAETERSLFVKTAYLQDQYMFKLIVWNYNVEQMQRYKLYNRMDVSFLVFNVMDLQSYQDVNKWREEVKKYGRAGVVTILVANTSSCTADKNRVVSSEVAIRFAAEVDMDYVEVNSETGEGVTYLMQLACCRKELPFGTLLKQEVLCDGSPQQVKGKKRVLSRVFKR